jgi:hypothetical protein
MNKPIPGVGRRLALCAATLLTVGTTVAAIGTAVTPAANADTPTGAQAQQASAQTGSITFTATRTVNGVAGQFSCSVAVETPHFLSSNDRSLVTGGEVLCTRRVPTIKGTITLYKDGRPVKSKPVTKHNTEKLLDIITYRCPIGRAHAYKAKFSGYIIAPPGFSPHKQPFSQTTATVHLRCHG